MKRLTIILAAVVFAANAVFAQNETTEKRWAVVELSTIYMRLQPDYESALETQELMGTIVEIVGEKGYSASSVIYSSYFTSFSRITSYFAASFWLNFSCTSDSRAREVMTL